MRLNILRNFGAIPLTATYKVEKKCPIEFKNELTAAVCGVKTGYRRRRKMAWHQSRLNWQHRRWLTKMLQLHTQWARSESGSLYTDTETDLMGRFPLASFHLSP
jgi:hypothetical protein